jgi:hypothetical protein
MVDHPETADIETSSEDYSRRFSGPVGSWFLRVQESATLKMLATRPGASVLDALMWQLLPAGLTGSLGPIIGEGLR